MAGIRFATSRSAISGGESNEPGSELRARIHTLNATVATSTAATPKVA